MNVIRLAELLRKICWVLIIITACNTIHHDRTYSKRPHYNYCISPEFDKFDKEEIVKGISIWNTLGEEHFSHSEELCDVLIRPIRREDFPSLKKDYRDTTLLGLSDYKTNTISLYVDKIYTYEAMETVIMHEGGHWIGLKHVPMKYWAVMNEYQTCPIRFRFYREDLKEYCRHWNCKNVDIDRIVDYYDQNTEVPNCWPGGIE